DRVGLDSDPGFDRYRSLSGDSACHPCHPGRSKARSSTRGYRGGAPVLVGISLSETRGRDSQRIAYSGKRRGPSNANLLETAVSGHRPQLLGAGTSWKDRLDSEP